MATLLNEEIVSTNDCFASPSVAKVFKVWLRRVEIELKMLIGTSTMGGWIKEGVGFVRVEEEGFPIDFYTSELEIAGISFSGTA